MNAVNSVNAGSTEYSKIASGKRINSAADDAAGMAIAQKMETQANGYDVGAKNAQDGISALQVADGALGGIMDSLQRIYELGLKASNKIAGATDLESIQSEISGLKDDISKTAKSTEFNSQKLLDGSMADMQLATNPEGGGMSIKMANATLEALGIENFDVTGDFSLNDIKNAMDKVSEARSNIGASSNMTEHTYNFNTSASLEQTFAQSKLEDLDIGKAISKQKQDELMDQYQIMMQKKQEEQDGTVLKLF